MKNKFYIRSYIQRAVPYMEPLKKLLEKYIDDEIELIYHQNISITDFNILKDENLISVDKYISEKLNIPYFQISRIFNKDGDVVDYICDNNKDHYDNVRILDSDMVFGNTISKACALFNTSKYSVLLKIKVDEELIDIEDLLLDNSYIQNENGINKCSYLINQSFFVERTSLPYELYEPIKKFITMMKFIRY